MIRAVRFALLGCGEPRSYPGLICSGGGQMFAEGDLPEAGSGDLP